MKILTKILYLSKYYLARNSEKFKKILEQSISPEMPIKCCNEKELLYYEIIFQCIYNLNPIIPNEDKPHIMTLAAKWMVICTINYCAIHWTSKLDFKGACKCLKLPEDIKKQQFCAK